MFIFEFLLSALFLILGTPLSASASITPTNPLIIIPTTLGSFPSEDGPVLDPIFHTYDNLIATFVANGYVEGQTLFPFPYNFEQSLLTTTGELANKVAEVQVACTLPSGCDKVDIIGHGQGGLIAWQYAQTEGTTTVDQLVLLGTPLVGVPAAYLAAEGGVFRLHSAFVGRGLGQALLNAEAQDGGFATPFAYVQSEAPAFAQMVPIVDYLFSVGTSYPDGYPTNPFIENLLSSGGFGNAVVYNLAADTNAALSTIQGFFVGPPNPPGSPWEHGQPTGEPTLVFGGDRVTPRENIEGWINPDPTFFVTDHGGLPTAAQSFLFQTIAGIAPTTVVENSYPVDNILFLALSGDANMSITGPGGNAVPGAFYSGANASPEYMVIPNPQAGEYKVTTTGSGSRTVVTSCIDSTGTISQEFSAAAGGEAVFTFNVATNPCALDAGPEPLDPVVIIPGILGSWEKNGKWVIDPVLHTYDNLIDTFLANGYVEGETLFKFPYDWRSSNITTAFLLKNKIEEIKQICDCSKVDLIGHSMGGLVAVAYIERDDYQNDVDQLFLVATPLKGAPYAYKTWEGGIVDFGSLLRTALAKIFFKNEARKNGYGVLPNSIYNYIHGWPITSIQELLPVNKNYLSTFTETLEYPIGYPGNLFLEELVTNFDFIVNEVELNVIRANTNNLDTLDQIIIEPSTQLPKWEHGQPVNDIFGAGDGTVPLWSIEDVAEADIEFSGVDHNEVVSSGIGYIFETIVGETPDSIVDNTYNIPLSFVLFKLLSPIDMQIVAPDGKKLGKNFEGGGELDEIPDAFYSGFNTEDEYAIILNPLPGKYEIKTIGTGSGSYTIAADYSNLATTSTAEVTDTTVSGEVISHFATLSATTTDIALTIDTQDDKKSLEELIVLVKEAIKNSNLKEKLKKNLLKKIENIEKKIKKQKNKKALKKAVKLKNKILKKIQKGKILNADAEAILDLLTQIENML